MAYYDNPVNHIFIREKAFNLMLYLSTGGWAILFILTIAFFYSTYRPIVIVSIFYFLSSFGFWRFYKKGKKLTPNKIWLQEDSFGWIENDTKRSVKYSDVFYVERVNDGLYIVHYRIDEEEKELYLHWALAEEIEERAGFYPWGKRELMEKYEKTSL